MDNPARDKPIGYKPGLLIGRQYIDTAKHHVVCSDRDGREKWRIAWADISGLAFVEHTARGALISRLDIHTRDGDARRSLGCNSMALEPRSDPEHVAFRSAAHSIAERLAQLTPELPVTVGEYGRTRLWMFGIGAVAFIVALALAVTAFARGREEALAPVAILSLFGLFVAWNNAPWRQLPRIPVALFAKALGGPEEADRGDAAPGD